MRLRKGPLTEASAVFGVAWLAAFLIYSGATASFNTGFGVALTSAIFYFMPSFTLWALAGLFTRRKATVFKFVTNLSVTSVYAIAMILLLDQALHASTGAAGSAAKANASFVYVSIAGYFVGSVIGAAATYFWLTKEKK